MGRAVAALSAGMSHHDDAHKVIGKLFNSPFIVFDMIFG